MTDPQFIDALLTMAGCGALLGILLPIAWPQHFDPLHKATRGER